MPLPSSSHLTILITDFCPVSSPNLPEPSNLIRQHLVPPPKIDEAFRRPLWRVLHERVPYVLEHGELVLALHLAHHEVLV